MCILSLSCFHSSFNHLIQSHNNFHNNAFQKDKRNERDCEVERNDSIPTTTLMLAHTHKHKFELLYLLQTRAINIECAFDRTTCWELEVGSFLLHPLGFIMD